MSDPASVTAVSPSAPVEVVPPVVEPAAPVPQPTLLSGEAEKPTELAAPGADVPPVVEPPTEPLADPGPTPEPVAEPPQVVPPSYEPFTFPEGLVVAPDDENLAKFVELAGGRGLSQEDGQGLIDLYSAQATKYAAELQDHLVQRQFDTFADTVRGWEQQFRDDPEFKNRVETVINDARWAVRELSGSDEAARELRDVLLASGTGNHRAVIRAFATAARRLKEGRPPPVPVPNPARSGSPADRRYGRAAQN